MITPHQIVELVAKDDPVILDIGCNDGEHTQMFLDLFPRARVFCFEPDPRAVQRFRVTDVRAQLFPVAVGIFDGVAPFHQSSGWPYAHETGEWDLSGSLRRPTGHLRVHPWCQFKSVINVPVVQLDTWAQAQALKHVDFIWADVQGAEGDLVQGGLQTLAQTRFFYTEYGNRELYEGQITLQQLAALIPRFACVQTWENDVLFRNTDWTHA